MNYYNEIKNKLIDNALWYLGTSNSNALYASDGYYADDVYISEKNSFTYGSNPTKWVGSIAMMYVSDYMYATDLNICKNPASGWDENLENQIDYSNDSCKTNNWLYNGEYQYFLNASSSDGATVGYTHIGTISEDAPVEFTGGIRPVVVLKSNVKVTGGSGTSNNPYTLGIDE